MTPGVYPGLSFHEYLRIPALNFSTLKTMERTPAHANEQRKHPKDQTDAQLFGQAVHAAVLEPDSFAGRFNGGPDKAPGLKVNKDGTVSKVGVENKRAWKLWEERYPQAEILPRGKIEACTNMTIAASKHETLGAMLRCEKKMTELAVVWRDEQTEALCKARLDLVVFWNGFVWVVDLKSNQGDGFKSADMWRFSRDLHDLQYHCQAAWYLEGLNTVKPTSGVSRRFAWAAMEATAPWAIAMYEPADECLKDGRRAMRSYLDTWVECEKSGVWPGYDQKITYIDLPGFKQKQRELE